MTGRDLHHLGFYAREMDERVSRPLGDDRERAVRDFVTELAARPAGTVLEVGCGAGRDGLRLVASGWRYVGLDVSPRAAEICRDLGLEAVVATATNLPVGDASIQALWSMSTLMHLDDTHFARALAELTRVLVPGSRVAIGVWGADIDREWTSPDGRYFRHRSDNRLREELAAIGEVQSFETWDRHEDGGHYQLVQLVAG